MPSTWLGLETSRRGMIVHQYALDTTGHNLANASTEGYTRQEVVITPTDPYSNPMWNSSVTPGQVGTGTKVQMIRRVMDEYLEHNVLKSATDTSYWQEQVSVMQRAEASFAEPDSDGINTSLVDFFKSWMDLNNTPQDPGVKSAVVELGDELANLMSDTYEQLDETQKTVLSTDSTSAVVSGSLKDGVDRVNDVLKQINDLTTSIKKIYALNQQPNDLLDKRDQLLEELAGYGAVSLTNGYTDGKPNGDLQVTFMGQTVIDSTDPAFQAVTLSLKYNDNATPGDESDDTVQLLFTDSAHDATNPLRTIDLTEQKDLTGGTDVSGGSLLGLEKARQNVINFKNMLNNLALTLENNIKADSTTAFFQGDLQIGNFKVLPDLLNDPSKLDGDIAKDNANVRTQEYSIAPLTKTCTMEEYFGILTTEVGNAAKSTDGMAANQTAIKEQIAALKDSVSGVSVDEEMTKMLQYQYGFQASARMVTTIDGMLDVIINKMA